MQLHCLSQKVAIVTGGSGGIGKAIASKFSSASAKVIIFGTNVERGNEAVKEIQSTIPNADISFMQVDVANHSAVKEAITLILEQFGRVDILVNNAGITRDQLLMKMPEEDWDLVMDVNVKSCYNTSHALVRSMMKQRTGVIINVGSVIGLMGNRGQVNYAASKAAVVGFTKALAKELAPRNIRVNCLAPGFIVTQMTESLVDQQKEEILQKIPLKRFGSAEEVADTALFLASDSAKYITGQVIAIDGGLVMG